MANVSDLNNIQFSGLNHIDALLDTGPNWNYLTTGGNTLLFTFSITDGNENGKTGQHAFSAEQQTWVRTALTELQSITGIQFAETEDGNAAQIHFSFIDIKDSSNLSGLCSWHSSYSYDSNNVLVSYDADAYVYLDDNEWFLQNRDLTPGDLGYQTLLHELGHALGLKHPFEGAITLPAARDDTSNTVMSYNNAGRAMQHYSPYDIAALHWLYGGDGLRGALGSNSTGGGRFIVGTNASNVLDGTVYDDKFEGDGGNDHIDGGNGVDTAVFRGPRTSYTVSELATGALSVSGGDLDGTDTLDNIEILQFSDGSFQRSQLFGDTTPPPAPTLTVAKNANGYAMGATPLLTGEAEAGSVISLYSDGNLVGTTQADSSGIWSVATTPLRDGLNYSVYATATDGACNVSQASAAITFNVDAHAPWTPSGKLALDEGKNQPVFSGTAEPGTMIQLVNVNNVTEIARTVVRSDGTWNIDSSPLPNGEYNVSVVAVDSADNATSSKERLPFTINSELNMSGDAGANSFVPGLGNNAVDGMEGVDKAVYDAPRANFTVTREVYGYSVVDTVGNNGHDSLINVERVQFSDGKWLALDIDGPAGLVYRLYQAAFNRVPDASGYAFWLDAIDHGVTLEHISSEFLSSEEGHRIYMSDPSDVNFITQLYHNVLHREPDGPGYQWWLDNVANDSRAHVLMTFSESPENQAQVIGSIQNGIEYTPLQA